MRQQGSTSTSRGRRQQETSATGDVSNRRHQQQETNIATTEKTSATGNTLQNRHIFVSAKSFTYAADIYNAAGTYKYNAAGIYMHNAAGMHTQNAGGIHT